MGVGGGKMWRLGDGELPDVGGENEAHASIPPVLGLGEILARREVGRQPQERGQNEAEMGRMWGKNGQNRPMRCRRVEMTFPMSRGLLPTKSPSWAFSASEVEMTFPMSRGLLRLPSASIFAIVSPGGNDLPDE